MQNDRSPYDLLGSNYAEYAQARGAYLAAVDEIIIGRLNGTAKSLLDIGSGDGRRIARIAGRAGITKLVLVDPSKTMCEFSRDTKSGEVFQTRAEDLPEFGIQFDAITCLWNVLGHVASSDLRNEALRRMGNRLKSNGEIYLDVNNRYNGQAYGWIRTAGRMVYDFVRPSESNGDVAYTWNVGGQRIHATGHVFTPSEMAGLIKEAGLKVKLRTVVDYSTGRVCNSVYSGQLFYVLGKGPQTDDSHHRGTETQRSAERD